MPKARKEFHEYIVETTGKPLKGYSESPATAFLRYATDAKDASVRCTNIFPNTFHSVDRLGDSSYCECGDEYSIGFYMTCPKILNIGGKFLFTFKNEYEETVRLILDISKDHTIKAEFVDASEIP